MNELIDKLRDRFSEHAQYWDCRNDEPSEEDNASECVKIALEFTLEALAPWKNTYMGRKQIEKYKEMLKSLP